MSGTLRTVRKAPRVLGASSLLKELTQYTHNTAVYRDFHITLLTMYVAVYGEVANLLPSY